MPTTPHPKVISLASLLIFIFLKANLITTSTPSQELCPLKLVPAALNVIGVL